MHFVTIDIIFIALILVFAIKAAAKGFVDEFFGLATFIFGAFLAFKFAPKLTPFIPSSTNKTLASVLSFVILFVVFFIIIKILQTILKGIFSGEILGSLDRSLGFFYGLLEGLLFVAIILLLMNKLQPWIDTESFRKDSFFNGLAEKIFDNYSSVLPGAKV